MLNRKLGISLIATSVVAITSGCATTSQPTSQALTVSDYQRAERQLRSHTNKLVYGTVEASKWLGDNRLLYRTSVKGGHEFVIADAAKGAKAAAFDHAAIASALSNDEKS
ncbi:MAG: hypothetical protein ACPGR2_18110, partial [Psychrobium sp.]